MAANPKTYISISTPAVIIDNVAIGIVPDSFEYTPGHGKQMVRVVSAGGGSISTVVSDDVKTHLSTSKFKVYPRGIDIDLIDTWKANPGQHVLSVIDPVTGAFSKTFNEATCTNDPDIKLSADGVVEIEWMSLPPV